MNLPNKLTISRIALTIAFTFFLFMHGFAAKFLALSTFLLASLTDLLDGFIAKRNNQITDFGKLMDPIADKILVLSAFFAFVELNVIPAWMFVIIIFREVTITGLRGIALTRGKVISADDIGKHKTVSQVVAIFVILVFLILREGGKEMFGFWSENVETLYGGGIYILMLVTIALTLISGVVYIVRNKGVYSNVKKD